MKKGSQSGSSESISGRPRKYATLKSQNTRTLKNPIFQFSLLEKTSTPSLFCPSQSGNLLDDAIFNKGKPAGVVIDTPRSSGPRPRVKCTIRTAHRRGRAAAREYGCSL